jgi:hypothetical protein
MRWAGLVTRMGKIVAYRFLVGKLYGKRVLARPRDNIKVNI